MYTSFPVLTCWKLGIEHIGEDALMGIRSKLSTSNIAQELFSSFAARWASTATGSLCYA